MKSNRNIKPNWIGYARVSTTEQHLGRQIKALTNSGVARSNIYEEKVSGAHANNRPKLQQMLKDINRTNVVVVLALDRLGRNFDDLNKIMRKISDKGARLVVLSLPLSKKYGTDKMLGSILNKFIIQLSAYQADHERKVIRARQRQGIAIAKKNGKYKGGKRQYHLDDPTVMGAINAYMNRDHNGMSAVEIARMNGMSRTELYLLKDRYLKKTHGLFQGELKTK